MTSLARVSALGLPVAALAAGLLIGAPSDAAPALAHGATTGSATTGSATLGSPTTGSATLGSPTQLGEDGGLRGEGYLVETSVDALSVGKEGFITVQIQAQEGFKVNDQYPHKIKFKNVPDGVALPKMVKKAQGKFKGKKTFTFRVPVTASKAGTFKISGKLKFSVCNDKSCVIQKKNIRVALNAS